MSNLLYGIVFLGIFLLINLKNKRGFTDPLILHTIAWLLVFLIGYFNYSKFSPLGDFFWKSWLLWFSSFSIGYYVFFFKGNKEKVIEYESLPNYSFFLNILTLAFFSLTIVQGLTGSYGNFLMNLRLSFILKTNNLLQPFFYLFTFIWPLFLYEGVVYKNKKNIYALILYCLVYTLASGGKFGVLMTFSAVFLIFSHRASIKRKYIVYGGIISVVLIALINLFRAQQEEGSFLIYSYAPLVAYGNIVDIQTHNWGHETFRFFYSMFYTIGVLDVQPPNDFYDYTTTPFLVNVYTALRPFYVDFGLTGVLFGGLVYGLFFGYCYKGYLKGKLVQSALYFGFAFTIISIPFSDLLFLNISLIIRTLIILLILFVTVNRKIKFVVK